MPAILERRADWLERLALALEAGLPAAAALKSIAHGRRGSALRGAASEIESAGGSLVEALHAHAPSEVSYETDLLRAAEDGGRLPESLKDLAKAYRSSSRMHRKLRMGCAYPALLVLVAVFVSFLIGALVRGVAPFEAGATAAVGTVVVFLASATIWMLAGSLGWGRWFRPITDRLPFWGAAQRAFATARLAMILRVSLQAGILPPQAWARAVRATGRADWVSEVGRWGNELALGGAPGDLLIADRPFPEVFVGAYKIGESSGKLDQSLGQVESVFREEGERKMDQFVEWLPRAVYAVVALGITIGILAAGAAYANWITRLAS